MKNDTHSKLKELEAIVDKPNYSDDKNGWVEFNVNKPKQKLRKYITGLAQKLCAHNKKAFRVNRDLLIKYYNEDGFSGLNRVMFINLIKEEDDAN